jgi:hypothetical protein
MPCVIALLDQDLTFEGTGNQAGAQLLADGRGGAGGGSPWCGRVVLGVTSIYVQDAPSCSWPHCRARSSSDVAWEVERLPTGTEAAEMIVRAGRHVPTGRRVARMRNERSTNRSRASPSARLRIRPPKKQHVIVKRLRRATRGKRGSIALAVLTFVLGLVSGYMSDLAKLALPPGLLLDAASSETVRVTVLRERDQSAQGELWLLPYPLSTTRPDLAEQIDGQMQAGKWDEVHDKLYKAGGIDVNVSLMKIIVEGRRNTPVIITGMRALVEKDAPTTAFTLIGPGPQGNAATGKVAFNLDEDDPIARVPTSADIDRSEYFGLPYFSDNTVSLARGEKYVFQVTASTQLYDVKWRVELSIQVDGDEQRLVIDDNGKPLRTVVGVYSPGGGRWSPDGSRYTEAYDVLNWRLERSQ